MRGDEFDAGKAEHVGGAAQHHAAELFPLAVATLAGLLVALSPQLAYHAIALLPDPLAPLPLLIAIWLLIR
ncbi:MAG TPA: hypothetical protein VE821_06440, partial [Pyrinomonadaceae bacterium]|nr:hypothetical protein [Pyrinomonadaceae bacterium]